jgi:diguanylate cyclase (GGDEF)-like protein
MSEKLYTSKRDEGSTRQIASQERPPLSEEISDLVGRFHRFTPEKQREILTEIADRVRELEEKSRTDDLTGLLNRVGFREEVHKFESLFDRERKNKNLEIPTALLMFDLDGFKEVNDQCQHSGGDRALQIIASEVKNVLRESDSFARIGGDEFAIFLTEDDEEGALHVAERVRAVIEGKVSEMMRKEFPAYQGQLSASIGVIAIDGKGLVDGQDLSLEKKIKLADYVAYVVKASGKKGEFTLRDARDMDGDGKFQKDFNAGKSLSR